MNLPNMLTALRFVLIPIYVVVFVNTEHKILAFLIVVAAGITDILDGYIARRTGQVTYTGMLLDPLADKLMIIAVIVSLLLAGMLSWGSAAAMFLRDLGMIAGGLFFHFTGKRTVPANWMGKLTTVLLYAALLFIFLEAPFARAFLWVCIAFSFLTTFVYALLAAAANRTGAGGVGPREGSDKQVPKA